MGVTPPKQLVETVFARRYKGFLLDTTVFVSAERQGQNPSQILSGIVSLPDIASLRGNDTPIGISVITIAELAHGAARADTAQRRQKHDAFIQELLTALSIYPITAQIALRAYWVP
jgi:predicted nucleic acid-binding protein